MLCFYFRAVRVLHCTCLFEIQSKFDEKNYDDYYYYYHYHILLCTFFATGSADV